MTKIADIRAQVGDGRRRTVHRRNAGDRSKIDSDRLRARGRGDGVVAAATSGEQTGDNKG